MAKAEEEQNYQDQLNTAGKNFDDFVEKALGKPMTPEQRAAADKLFGQFVNITEGNKTELSAVMSELATATGLPKQAIITATEKLWPIHADDQTKKDLVLDGAEPFAKEAEEELQKTITALEKDIVGIKGFITEEFVKLVKNNNGKIDIDDPNFQLAANSLINADPKDKKNEGKAVLSFTATEQGIKEKIDKLIKKGVPAERFETLIQTLESEKAKFNEQIKTNEGIQDLVVSRVKEKLIEGSINFFTHDKDGNPVGIDPQVKKDIVSKLKDNITIPPSLTMGILQGNQEIISQAKEIMNSAISQGLGTNKGNYFVLDNSKLDYQGIGEVAKAININLEVQLGQKVNKQELADGILADSIKQLEKTYGVKVNEDTAQKIKNTLGPKIAELDATYLVEKSHTIVGELTKELKKEQSYLSRIGSEYRVARSNLEKIGNNLGAKHQKSQELEAGQKISQMISDNIMSNTDIKDRLNVFLTKSGLPPLGTSDKLPDNKKLIELRKIDPKKFDMIFSKPSVSPRSKSGPIISATKIGNDINHGRVMEPRGRSKAVEMDSRQTGTAVTEKQTTTAKDKPAKPPRPPRPRKPESGWVH